MSGPSHSVLLIGGPDTGKSNYLFRFWIAVDAGNGILVKNGLPADFEYLQAGANQLLDGNYAGHTSHEVHDKTAIPVQCLMGGDDFHGILVVPDVPGEQVLAIYRKRYWSREWEDAISEGCGCLLFIRPDSPRLIHPADWAIHFELYGGPPSPAPEPEKGEASNGKSATARRKPETDSAEEKGTEQVKTPTQVVMVEWLQFLRRAFTDQLEGSFRPRIGIVVAAWDAIPNEQQNLGAEAWVAANFCLLHQFLASNEDAFEVQFFGISVSSGDLKNDPAYRLEYLEGDPRNTGYVINSLEGEIKKSPDMTLPVAWAMGIADRVLTKRP